jgi:hypothetical protein
VTGLVQKHVWAFWESKSIRPAGKLTGMVHSITNHCTGDTTLIPNLLKTDLMLQALNRETQRVLQDELIQLAMHKERWFKRPKFKG